MKKGEETIRTYKGTDKDMKCRGFQFEPGGEYETKGRIKACENGFHACERPLDVFNHYPPATSRYFAVEQSGDLSPGGDTKVASRKIKIGEELGIPGLVRAQIEYVKAHTTTEHTDPERATAGDYGAATAGDYGAATAGAQGAATAGVRGAATAGNYGAATAGDRGAATAGVRGAATAGNYGAAAAGARGAATAGDRGAATAGDYGAATAGDYGAATSRGSVTVGKNGCGLVRGANVKIRGGLGAILAICVEPDNDYIVKEWKSFVIDGETYKPGAWYTLRDGEIVEVGEE